MYGTLILSSTSNGGPLTYSGTGASPLNIRGDLKIGAAVIFSIGMSADLVVHKNLNQSVTSVLNLQNSTNNNVVRILGDIACDGTLTETGGGAPILELSGTNHQRINITGSIQNNVTLKLDNASGFMLVSPLTINNKLEFANGKLKTDAVNILTLADGASYTGASTASFVEGPVRKIGDEDFNFPVGAGSIYAPIGISGSGGDAADEFVAEYKRQNPQSTPGLGNVIENTIHHISSSEHWVVTRNAGTSAKKNQLTVSEYSFARNLNTLLVARFDGVQWRNEGATNFIAGASAPPNVTGTFQSATSVGSFGTFTIGTTEDLILNPLPVKLFSFDATQPANNTATLYWVITEACLTGVEFELQRALNNAGAFETIAVIEGNQNERRYEFTDNNLKEGINYYRLKIKDENDVTSYSMVVSAVNWHGHRVIGALTPSIVTNTATLAISSNTDQLIDLVIFDIHGRVWKIRHEKINKGITRSTLLLDDLPGGVYHISIITRTGSRNVVRFIKQHL